MDQMQIAIKSIKNQHPTCLSNRQILKSVLSDYLPGNKLNQNLILNAFDEGIVSKLDNSSDATMAALQMIKQLQTDYGITPENSFWAVETWCYILTKDAIAAAISVLKPTQSIDSTHQQLSPVTGQEYKVGLGIYRAGIDFPTGELSIQVDKKTRLGIFYGISKNPNKIDTNKEFRDKAYFRIEDGQYLKLYCYESSGDYTFTVRKMD